MTHYLNVEHISAMHDALLARLGAPRAALRDRGLLESAVMRPQMAAHYEDADIVRQAALLAIGISQAQAFLDGNKRSAYAACEVFLDLDGYEITGDPLEMAQQLEAVAERTSTLEDATAGFEAWLRGHVAPRSSSAPHSTAAPHDESAPF
jgi:death on curing protein